MCSFRVHVLVPFRVRVCDRVRVCVRIRVRDPVNSSCFVRFRVCVCVRVRIRVHDRARVCVQVCALLILVVCLLQQLLFSSNQVYLSPHLFSDTYVPNLPKNNFLLRVPVMRSIATMAEPVSLDLL